jgi:hypothetical protein
MSFDIFLMSFHPDTFDRTIVEKAFQAVGISLEGARRLVFSPA